MLRACTRLAPRAPGVAALACCRGVKTTTGIVGLEVQPEAKSMLEGLYSKTLATLEETVPAGAEYRNVIEALTKKRLAVVQGTSDLSAIEAQLGAGQVEQLIQQAQDELDLIPKMAAARVWEPYEGSPVEDLYTDLKRCASPLPPPKRSP